MMVARADRSPAPELLDRLSGKPVVLVGMMGAGKTSVGRLLARRLGWEFIDADTEIEASARRSIDDIFADSGERGFREGERRVLAGLVRRRNCVIATGGGAFDDPGTRAKIRAEGVSVWLDAGVDVLLERVSCCGDRPLLRGGDMRETLERLAAARRPGYAEADIAVETGGRTPGEVADHVLQALAGHCGMEAAGPATR